MSDESENLHDPAIAVMTQDPPVPPPTPFEIRSADPLSFAVLRDARGSVFDSEDHRQAFARMLESMSTAGEEGRRRGLGYWVLGEYARSAEELDAHQVDDTAAFTRAKSLFALDRFPEALAIYERLSNAYPKEPRPREGWLESRLELGIAADPEDTEPIATEIESNVLSAPGDFAEVAEGRYLLARVAELRRDWENALELYHEGRQADPAHTGLIQRFGHLAERHGLDDLALSLYENLVLRGAASRSVLLNLGVLYEDYGRDSDAAACYDTVLKCDTTDQPARLYLQDARAAIDMYYDEDMEKKEDRLNQILRIPITDFELSVRARNCLNKMQITTLGDLVQRTEQELLSYKNFGETSLTEIKEILHSKGLRLGMPREEAVASIEAHANRTSASDRSNVLNKPILDLQLSIRARRTVETLGCLTVGDITKHSAEELLGMPNFGQTSLQELRSKLGELGIKLKGD